MRVKRNKFGRFEKVTDEINNQNEIRNDNRPELASSEATLVIAENLARVAEALSLSTINKLSPLLKKVNTTPIYGTGFNVEKYPLYFKDLCTQLNNIHCSLETIASTIDAVDF